MADFDRARFLLFRIGEVACAADIRSIREIVPISSATRVPGAPEAVIGMINVRGQLVTLVDGRRLLQQPATDETPSVVLLDVGAETAGLAVDEVVDMISVTDEVVADRDELLGVESRLVRAVGHQDDLSFVVLDTDALLEPILPS